MSGFEKGKYVASLAASPRDVQRAQRLRAVCFDLEEPMDCDGQDDACDHVLIETRAGRDLVCCFRMRALNGATLREGYAAQYYDLSALESYDGPVLELGRFCTAPGCNDPDVMRLAWGTLTQYVDRNRIRLLCGCSSFWGTDPTLYGAVFARLRARHLAPARWAPKAMAAEYYCFSRACGEGVHRARNTVGVPPLLRSYLTMGAWVSDHAVIDRRMNTLHVFTGLEVDAISATRKRLLREMSA